MYTWLRGSKKITGWSETMWRILSANADPQDLSAAGTAGLSAIQWRLPRGATGAFPHALLVSLVGARAMPGGHPHRGAAGHRLQPARRAGGRGGMHLSLRAPWGCWTSSSSRSVRATASPRRRRPGARMFFLRLIGVFLLYLRSTNRELPQFRFGGRRRQTRPRPGLQAA